MIVGTEDLAFGTLEDWSAPWLCSSTVKNWMPGSMLTSSSGTKCVTGKRQWCWKRSSENSPPPSSPSSTSPPSSRWWKVSEEMKCGGTETVGSRCGRWAAESHTVKCDSPGLAHLNLIIVPNCFSLLRKKLLNFKDTIVFFKKSVLEFAVDAYFKYFNLLVDRPCSWVFFHSL